MAIKLMYKKTNSIKKILEMRSKEEQSIIDAMYQNLENNFKPKEDQLSKLVKQVKKDILTELEIDVDDRSVEATLNHVKAIEANIVAMKAVYKAYRMGFDEGVKLYKR